MKRTMLAVGVAVLVSMMLVPDLRWADCTVCVVVGRHRFNPFDGRMQSDTRSSTAAHIRL